MESRPGGVQHARNRELQKNQGRSNGNIIAFQSCTGSPRSPLIVMIRSVACIAARRRDRRRRASAHPRRRTDTAVVCRATGLPAHVQISATQFLIGVFLRAPNRCVSRDTDIMPSVLSARRGRRALRVTEGNRQKTVGAEFFTPVGIKW